jgi:hypothetical protein
MSAAATVLQTSTYERELASVQDGDRADQLGRLVVGIVALVEGQVDPSTIVPAALVLAGEGLVDLPGVTFGCNYDLDVRSFELRRGYARAIDAGWLTLRSRKVSVNPNFAPAPATTAARARATELCSLRPRELMGIARHHLLHDAD